MAYCANCGNQISDQAVACPSCGHPGPGVRAASSTQAGAYAGWWQRVVAAIIDGLVVAVPSWILMAILSVGFLSADEITFDPVTGQPEVSSSFFTGFLVSWLIILLLGIAYRVVLEGGPRGQTLGKMAMRIKVQDAAGGGPIGYGRAFIRWIVATVLWIVLYIPGVIDVLFPLWDAKKQTIHDKAASTVVVQVA